MNTPLPDIETQALWDRVSAESDDVASTIVDIARLTVGGHETRTALSSLAAHDVTGDAGRIALHNAVSGRGHT